MIKIYKEKDFSKNLIEILKKDSEIWSFPIEELGYLLEEHDKESFILINNRLYEFNIEKMGS